MEDIWAKIEGHLGYPYKSISVEGREEQVKICLAFSRVSNKTSVTEIEYAREQKWEMRSNDVPYRVWSYRSK
jgi:hypothetical protein